MQALMRPGTPPLLLPDRFIRRRVNVLYLIDAASGPNVAALRRSRFSLLF